MSNFKSCVPCVCTGSGHKRVCEEQNNSIELTEFLGCFCPFNLEEFEMKLGNLADCNKAANELTQGIVASQQVHVNTRLRTQLQIPNYTA